MRGRAAVLLSLVSFLSLTAAADCNYSLLYSGQFRASYLDLAVDGNDLWAATSYGVSLFNRAVDPPALVATLAVPGVTRAVRVINGTVFAASGTRVYVIRRNGNALSLGASYDAGVVVNDLVATTLYLYLATGNGLQQVDVLTLQKTPAVLTTSSPGVTSLSLAGSTLYAADGDSSIEVFNIAVPTVPAHTGTLASLPRVTSVDATETRLYASDGVLSTDVFLTNGVTTHAATASGGTSALSVLAGDVIFTATAGRVRAIDWSSAASPVDLFSTDIVPNGGTINRVSAMQIAGGRLYVAAGDSGLLTYDVSSFTAPFAVRSYPTGAMTSTAWVDGKLYASRSGGGISEFVKTSSTGYLTAARQWDAHVQTVYEGAGGFLLTSSGKTLYFWTLVSTTPTLITSADFASNIVSATMRSNTAYVALDDQSVWTADLSALSPAPKRVDGYSANSVKATGSAVVFAYGLAATATTTVGTLPIGNTQSPPVTVSGLSTVPVAASGTTAAVFTFTGINVIGSGAPFTLPNSSSPIARRLAISGTELLELTDTSLVVWDLSSKKAIRTIPLPAAASSLAVDTIAGLATPNGVETVAFDTPRPAPPLLATRNGNLYYRKVAVSPDRLYLGTTSSVDVYETTYGTAPHELTSFRAAGIVDFAATATGFATLSNAAVVTVYSREGGVVAQRALDVDSGTQPLAIFTAGSALWVSISRGCTTGGCEKKTLVLDPLSLAQTATLDGGAVDVTTAGTRAFAVFDLPAEVRTYDVSTSLTPVILAHVAASGTRTPVSIAFANNTVLVAGDKLYGYDPLLTQRSDNLDAYQTDTSGATAFGDQRVRAENTCALFSRGLQPVWLALPQVSGTNVPASAVVRSIAQSSGRFWVLTDDALEIWSSSGASAPPPRRRAAGH